MPLSTWQWQQLLRDVLIPLGQEWPSLLSGLPLFTSLTLGLASFQEVFPYTYPLFQGPQHVICPVFSFTVFNTIHSDAYIHVTACLMSSSPISRGPMWSGIMSGLLPHVSQVSTVDSQYVRMYGMEGRLDSGIADAPSHICGHLPLTCLPSPAHHEVKMGMAHSRRLLFVSAN